MWEDEIVNEVHRVREAYLKRFNYDLEAIYQDIKKREQCSEHKIVAPPVWPQDVPLDATVYNEHRYRLNDVWYTRKK